MRRNRPALVLAYLLVCAASEAAIPLNSLQTFDLAPGATNWATLSVWGGSAAIMTPEVLDIAIQTNDVATITNLLPATTSTFPLRAQWNSARHYLQSRSSDVAYQIILATIQNTSGRTLSSVAIACDFGNPVPPSPMGESPGLSGFRAYYSLTGQPGAWLQLPEFSTGETGNLAAVFPLASWPANSLLYLLWADNNGPGVDATFTIDNFIAMESLPPPPPPSVQPPSTNVLEGRTIELTFIGTGYGLTFQWIKDGAAIDSLLNPTANERKLVITNAALADSGQYRLAVDNLAGGTISDAVPVVVLRDDIPPRLVFAYDVPGDLRAFRLSVSEELCTNEMTCISDATFSLNWTIRSEDGTEIYFPETISIQGTNLEFTIQSNRTVGKRYVIGPDPEGSGIADIFGNVMPMGSTITSAPSLSFKQNVNGYVGTEDVEVRPPCDPPASCPLPGDLRILVDLENSGAESQGLLRFNNIFGPAPNQIPPGTRILLATLLLESTGAGANGDLVNLHRMLLPWSEQTATWSAFNNGIQANGIEAWGAPDAAIMSITETIPFKNTVDVTSSLQSWSDGAPNLGWVLLSAGPNGYQFDASESQNPPALGIVYDRVDSCSWNLGESSGSLTVFEGASFTLGVTLHVQGLCSLSFQWTRNGVDIPGATNGPTYSVASASLCDAGTYRLRVSDFSGHSVTSDPTIVIIPADITLPVLTGAFASADGTNITLAFSKVMNATNAVDLAHYVLDPLLPVTGVALSSDGRSVTLATAPRSPLTAYTLRIRDVTDNRAACVDSIGNVISPNPTLVQLTTSRIDVPWNAEWLYSTNSQDATLLTPAPWNAPNYSPGNDWRIGQALFGRETTAGIVAQFPAPLLTPVPANANTPPDPMTLYFRKQIELPPLPPGALYALCHFIDDGAVFYLDGEEIGRVNMGGAAPVFFAQRAPVALEASLQCLTFTATPGSHLLAVEVHQGGLNPSPDILFGVQVQAIAPSPLLDIRKSQPMISWQADSYWELLTSSNAAGPYAPVPVNPFNGLGVHHVPLTNSAAFYRLRFKGSAK